MGLNVVTDRRRRALQGSADVENLPRARNTLS